MGSESNDSGDAVIKFDCVKVGDILYHVGRERAGNTTMWRSACWTVRVLEIRAGGAMVSWNGNAPTFRTRKQVESYRRSPPKKRVTP